MDRWESATQMHIVLGADEGPVSHNLWTRVLLDVRDGLVERAAYVPTVQAKCSGATRLAFARIKSSTDCYIANCIVSSTLYMVAST